MMQQMFTVLFIEENLGIITANTNSLIPIQAIFSEIYINA